MTIKLKRTAILTLDPDDLAAVLDEVLCSGSFTPFNGSRVEYVGKNENGQFMVTIAPISKVPEQLKQKALPK